MFKRALYVTAWLISCAGYAQVGGPGTVVVGGGSGGGAGVTGLTSCSDGTALADNALMRADGTTKCQGSTVTVADSTGDLQWEGTTADSFEGNFTFADPTADWTWAWGADGALTGATQFNLENLRLDGNTISTTNTDGDLALAPNGDGNVTSTARILVPSNGTNNQYPGYSFVGDSDTGIYDDAANNTIKFTAGGSRRAYIGETAFALNSGVVAYLDTLLYLTPAASPPIACNGGNEGYIYTDTSHALCWCDGTTWQKLSGAGTCA